MFARSLKVEQDFTARCEAKPMRILEHRQRRSGSPRVAPTDPPTPCTKQDLVMNTCRSTGRTVQNHGKARCRQRLNARAAGGSSDRPMVAPSSQQPNTFSFTDELTGAPEIPPALTAATGKITMSLDVATGSETPVEWRLRQRSVQGAQPNAGPSRPARSACVLLGNLGLSSVLSQTRRRSCQTRKKFDAAYV